MSRTDRPACERVRRALDAIIASEAFSRSERLRSFLSYIVENELSGKAAQLKGYSIGIDVFGRPPGFDAGNDPLVRVQAGKLRKLLEQYYETEGAGDRLRIRVPLGSYVPEYSAAVDKPEAADERPEPCCQPSRGHGTPHARHHVVPGCPRRSPRRSPCSRCCRSFSWRPRSIRTRPVWRSPRRSSCCRCRTGLQDAPRRCRASHILQCWPSGGECNALARAIAGSAGYHRTVHLIDKREAVETHALSYTIRIENRSDGRGIYARLIHEQSGDTIYARHFSPEQLRSKAGIAYEAVNFAARTLSATGPLYRHALRTGTASGTMECLTHRWNRTRRAEHPLPMSPPPASVQPSAALAEAPIAERNAPSPP
jgi:hypothetical protein